MREADNHGAGPDKNDRELGGRGEGNGVRRRGVMGEDEKGSQRVRTITCRRINVISEPA